MSWRRPQELVHHWLESRCQEKFFKLGYFFAIYRWRTCIFCFAFVMLCSLGFLNFRTETRSEYLWLPSTSESEANLSKLEESFGPLGATAELLFVKSNEDNILNNESMESIWDAFESVTSIVDNDGNTFSDLCTLVSYKVCKVDGILAFWGNNRDAYMTAVSNRDDLLRTVSNMTFPSGLPVSRDLEFGNLVEDESSSSILSATAVRVNFQLNNFEDSENWQIAFLKHADETSQNFEGINIYYSSTISLNAETSKSVSKESFLFILALASMVVFAVCTLGSFHPVKFRSSLALASLFWILMSATAAYGICSGFGIPFTPLHQILPFILIGVGIDDVYIITMAFDDTPKTHSTSERVASAFARCGLSICYTSFLNFVIFAVGSYTLIPAIQYFSLYSAVAVFTDLFIQVPTYLAILSWDADRQEAGRYDSVFYFCSNNKNLGDHIESTSQRTNPSVDSNPDSSGPSNNIINGNSQRTSIFPKLFTDIYLRNLMSFHGLIVAYFITLGLIGVSIYGAYNVEFGLEKIDLVDDSSYLYDYYTASIKYNMYSVDYMAPMYLVVQDVDLTNFSIQREYLQLQEKFLEQGHVDKTYFSWLSDFLTWCSMSDKYAEYVDTDGYFSNAELFSIALDDFLLDPSYSVHKANVVISSDGFVFASRVIENQLFADVNKILDSYSFGEQAYAVSELFVEAEANIVIQKNIYINFSFGIFVVFISSVAILGHVRYALFVAALVALVDMEIYGLMYFFGLSINSITAILLIVTAGLITDMIVHIVHYFTAYGKEGSAQKKERILFASAEIGPSVFFAGLTTFIGVVPTAFGTNATYRIFFTMIVTIMGLGMVAGLMTVPAVLVLIPERKTEGNAVEDKVISGSSKG